MEEGKSYVLLQSVGDMEVIYLDPTQVPSLAKGNLQLMQTTSGWAGKMLTAMTRTSA